jgi:hypothetical protein
MAAGKSISIMSHVCMETSCDTCARRHQPAFKPVVFPTFFQGWYFDRLQ